MSDIESNPPNLILGWGAPKVSVQFPAMEKTAALHFDKDNEALFRLSIQGYLTDSCSNAAVRKITHAL